MSFDQMMIHYSAPTLCGIKPGNLFFIKSSDFSESQLYIWKKKFENCGFSLASAKSAKDTVFILVYDPLWLRILLGDMFVSSYLLGKGYKKPLDSTSVITELTRRIKSQKNFPHEVGIILGYPLLDVIEFEAKNGKDCKYCGYWKSYSDVEKAKKCMCSYKKCSCMCKEWFDQGYSVTQIICEYNKAVKAA